MCEWQGVQIDKEYLTSYRQTGQKSCQYCRGEELL